MKGFPNLPTSRGEWWPLFRDSRSIYLITLGSLFLFALLVGHRFQIYELAAIVAVAVLGATVKQHPKASCVSMAVTSVTIAIFTIAESPVYYFGAILFCALAWRYAGWRFALLPTLCIAVLSYVNVDFGNYKWDGTAVTIWLTLVGFSCIGGVGWKRVSNQVETQEEIFRKKLKNDQRELSVFLHNSVVSQLTNALKLLETISEDRVLPKKHLENLISSQDLIRSSVNKLRFLINGREILHQGHNGFEKANSKELLDALVRDLSRLGFTVESNIHELAGNSRARFYSDVALLRLFIGETGTNIIKYANIEMPVRVNLNGNVGGYVLEVENGIDQIAVEKNNNSSSVGIEYLTEVARESGAEIRVNASVRSWMITLTVSGAAPD